VECLSPNLWIVKGYDELYLTLDSVKVWVRPLKVRIAWTDSEKLRPVLWMSIIRSFHPTLCRGFTVTSRWYSRGRAYIPTFIQAEGVKPVPAIKTLEDFMGSGGGGKSAYDAVIETLGKFWGVREVRYYGDRRFRYVKVMLGGVWVHPGGQGV